MKTIVSILILLFGYNLVLACSCVVPDDKLKSEALRNSSVIFRGKVVSTDSTVDRDETKVKFTVLKAWKGVQTGEIVISTPPDSAACGYNFQAGETYTVYADGNPPSTNSCTMNTVDEKRIREVLGEGKTFENSPPPESKSSQGFLNRLWRKISSLFS